jgi:hypothetical protein
MIMDCCHEKSEHEHEDKKEMDQMKEHAHEKNMEHMHHEKM